MAVRRNSEIQRLRKWDSSRRRHPHQKNALNQADSEIIALLKPVKNLAVTTDMISDEIHWGLYRDPWTVGWMTAVVSLSDLAATGADPFGLLIGTHWGPKENAVYKKIFYQGLQAALKAHHTYLLGGDQSSGSETVLSSTAVGGFSQNSMQRTKIRPGDFIYALGDFGCGPALALRVLFELPEKWFSEELFRPQVHFPSFGGTVRAAIDVSDGLANSLCILSQLNQVSFDIDWPKDFFNPKALEFCQQSQIPETALVFAEHGDYQLLVAVSPADQKKFEKKFPKARRLAQANLKKTPDRIRNLNGEWQVCKLDYFFNSQDKNSLRQLRFLFSAWLRWSKRHHLK